ncbi:hypothetical protein BKA69DRAFT_632176 [Paraphysoderma sedebokerense]|nr:hypothetical protein BKA69DRAFT_632176 [Paraphysoderma sedebokerense]
MASSPHCINHISIDHISFLLDIDSLLTHHAPYISQFSLASRDRLGEFFRTVGGPGKEGSRFWPAFSVKLSSWYMEQLPSVWGADIRIDIIGPVLNSLYRIFENEESAISYAQKCWKVSLFRAQIIRAFRDPKDPSPWDDPTLQPIFSEFFGPDPTSLQDDETNKESENVIIRILFLTPVYCAIAASFINLYGQWEHLQKHPRIEEPTKKPDQKHLVESTKKTDKSPSKRKGSPKKGKQKQDQQRDTQPVKPVLPRSPAKSVPPKLPIEKIYNPAYDSLLSASISDLKYLLNITLDASADFEKLRSTYTVLEKPDLVKLVLKVYQRQYLLSRARSASPPPTSSSKLSILKRCSACTLVEAVPRQFLKCKLCYDSGRRGGYYCSRECQFQDWDACHQFLHITLAPDVAFEET